MPPFFLTNALWREGCTLLIELNLHTSSVIEIGLVRSFEASKLRSFTQTSKLHLFDIKYFFERNLNENSYKCKFNPSSIMMMGTFRTILGKTNIRNLVGTPWNILSIRSNFQKGIFGQPLFCKRLQTKKQKKLTPLALLVSKLHFEISRPF